MRFVVACLLLLMLVPRASATPLVPAAELDPAPCPIDVPAELLGTRQLTCGYVSVQLQRRDPAMDSGTLQLAVAVLSSGAAEAEPVVYLAGGPGGSALRELTLFSQVQPALRDLTADHDWIFVDQRGTGFSSPDLGCPEVSLGPEVDAATEVATTRACAARLAAGGEDLASFNTAENAADIADVIHALGLERVNLYGSSYGTQLALAVMQNSPHLVRSAVLDGVYPMQAATYADQPASMSRALRKVFEACRIDARCDARYPNLEDRFLRVVHRLQSDPRPIAYTPPGSETVRQVPLTARTFLGLVFVLLYQREGIELVPAVIGQTEAGDLGPVQNLIWILETLDDGLNLAMHYSVECADEGWRTGITTTDLVPYPEVHDELGTSTGLAEICADWPVSVVSADPVWSDIPALLLVGWFDPITPPEYAHQAASSLSNSTVVELAGLGHVTLPHSACAAALVRSFLADSGATLDTACARAGGPVFVLP
jgi:pimeloyl-ACP methyl ester carboxylesterase